MGTRWEQVEELFAAALARDVEQREAFVHASDVAADVRAEVLELLAHLSAAQQQLTSPAMDALDALAERDGLPVVSGVAPVFEAGVTIGAYTIVRQLGAGGMGAVYEAEQERPRRRVALKVLQRGLDSARAHERFRVEAEILGRLVHPGIAPVHDAGVHTVGGVDVPWFAMEYVTDATPIVTHAGAAGLTLDARLELFARVCEAVHHGHQNGVIHRDLKPDNILVDAQGEPRVIDFGVAVATDADLALSTLATQTGQIVGTLRYMSPEQLVADRNGLDVRTDVYSLGVVLFELLTGASPQDFDGLSLPAMAEAIRDEPARRPSALRATVPEDVDVITLTALEKDRERRYASASALAADVRRFLRREPIEARPASWTYQLSMFARRNRAVVGALAVVVLVSIAAAIVSVDFALDARDAELAADAEAENATLLAGIAAENEARALANERKAKENETLAQENARRATEAEEAALEREAEAVVAERRATQLFDTMLESSIQSVFVYADRIAGITGAGGLRRDLLLDSLARLEELLAIAPDNKRVRTARLETINQLTMLEGGMQGQQAASMADAIARAESGLEAGLGMIEDYGLDDPGVTFVSLLPLHFRGQLAAATNDVATAQQCMELFLDRLDMSIVPPDDPYPYAVVADSHAVLARLAMIRRDPHEAMEQYTQQLAIMEDTIARFPERFEAAMGLAGALSSVAHGHEGVGDLDQALRYHVRSLEATRPIAASRPNGVQEQQFLYGQEFQVARVLRLLERPDEALPHIDAALAGLSALQALEPGNPYYGWRIALCHCERGSMLADLAGRPGTGDEERRRLITDAVAAFERGIEQHAELVAAGGERAGGMRSFQPYVDRVDVLRAELE